MSDGKKSREQRLLEKRDALKRRTAEVDAELKKLAERKTKAEVARETRRKILLGGWLLDQMEYDDAAKALLERFLGSLKNEQDRRVFDLASSKDEAVEEGPKPATKEALEEI